MTTPKHDDRSTPVDSRVAAAWQTASNEEPPASIDAAILAAARREVGAGPKPIDTREGRADRRRWWPLAAAATIAAVVVGVLQVTPTEKLGAPATDTGIVSDVPAPAAPPAASIPAPPPASLPVPATAPPSAPPAASIPAPPPASLPVPAAAPPPVPTPAPLPAAKPAPGSAPFASLPDAPFAAPSESRLTSPAPTSTPDPFPAAKTAADATAGGGQPAAAALPAPSRSEAAANAADESNSMARERDARARGAAAPPRVAQSAAPSTAERAPAPASAPLGKMAAGRAADDRVDEARAKERTPLPVAEWVALIRRLRAEGKQAEAAKELAAFRAVHADHEKLLPPDLRDWREK